MASRPVTPVLLADGAVGSPSLAFVYQKGTGFFRDGSQIKATIKGTLAATISTTGMTFVGTGAFSGAVTVTSTSASALTVGRQGATNPVLAVDAATSSVVTGVKITGAATGTAAAVVATGSAADEHMTINAKGAGTLKLQSVATGIFTVGLLATPALTVTLATAGTGINITSAASGGGVAIAATGGTNEAVTFDGKGTGTIGIGTVSTGAITLGAATGVTGALTVTSAGASALAVGRLGATTPALQVDASAGTSITGLKITAAAAGNGLALAAVGEASNGNITIDAQGTGTLTLNGTATGNIVLGAAATGVSLSVTGGLTSRSATAVPATAGAVAAGAAITAYTEGWKLWVTSDAPSHTATKGDLCINTGGSSTSTRLYVNNGTTNWVAITTAS